MLRNIFWWIIETLVWFCFFYLILFSCRNTVNIGWTSAVLVLLGSFGIFASPLTRHLSIWNKIIDQVIKKEEDKELY